MALKHRLKLALRDAYAWTLTYTGLYRLIDVLSPARLLILAGHCVRDPVNAGLPEDMKISAPKLEKILRSLAGFATPCTVSEGLAALDAQHRGALFALTMDDGYKDNATVLPLLLERTKARATVYLESRPLVEGRVNWSHKWFWLLGRAEVGELTREYIQGASDAQSRQALEQILEQGEQIAYRVKRVFKYQAPAEERDRLLDALFRARGGDEAQLCETLYMSLEEAKELVSRGIELG